DGMLALVRHADLEVPDEPSAVHPGAVVVDLDRVVGDADMHLGRVGVIRVVDQLAHQLQGAGVQLLSDDDQMATVDGDGQGRGGHDIRMISVIAVASQQAIWPSEVSYRLPVKQLEVPPRFARSNWLPFATFRATRLP